MKSSLGCCAFCLGVGFVAGACLVSNNSEVRNWFKSTSKKLNEMYDDIMKKVDSKISCTCSLDGKGQTDGSPISNSGEMDKAKKSN